MFETQTFILWFEFETFFKGKLNMYHFNKYQLIIIYFFDFSENNFDYLYNKLGSSQISCKFASTKMPSGLYKNSFQLEND